MTDWQQTISRLTRRHATQSKNEIPQHPQRRTPPITPLILTSPIIYNIKITHYRIATAEMKHTVDYPWSTPAHPIVTPHILHTPHTPPNLHKPSTFGLHAHHPFRTNCFDFRQIQINNRTYSREQPIYQWTIDASVAVGWLLP